MDSLDRAILDIIQTDFPLVSRPYAELAKRLGSSESEVFEHVCELRRQGVIRQLSANFWADRLGYVSTLCAAKVPQEQVAAFVEVVNATKGVTHNYLRDHVYNIWFTLIASSAETAQAILTDISQKTGIPILNLPAKKIFKIAVNFQMQ
ncbi:MAG: AsnC family transcriptional regulator [Desulfovibrio sp.]|nr:AsnC family transcriptional regulator [Desulfovibrio sp.]